MSIYTPYFYVIEECSSGKYYAGSKYGKDANPNTLLKEDGYLTSSLVVNRIIKLNGLNSFRIRKIRCFNNPSEAYEYETRFLKKVDAKNNMRFYNKHNNDFSRVYDPNWRNVKGSDGLTSYERGAKKAAETMKSTYINGKNVYQVSYEKSIKNNPNLLKLRAEKSKQNKLEIDKETGLTKYQLIGQKISGANNPSKKPENAKKISDGKKRKISENRELWLERQKKLNDYLSTHKDENGMTARDRHSEWMKENNPTRGSKWFNNGKENIRLKQDESIPDGYSPGRIKRS